MKDRVRFDADGAAQMLALLARLAAGEAVPQAEVDAALATPAYGLFFAHHNRFPGRSLEPAEFAAMLRAVPAGRFRPQNPQLERMWPRFREVPGRLPALRALHAEVAGGDVLPQAVALARRHLPAGAVLDTTVFILLDGMSGGFVYQGQVAFDLLQMRDAESFQRTLAHELHHIGVEHLWRDRIDGAGLPPAQHLALEFVGLLLGEGSATYLISGAPREPEGIEQWQGHMAHLDALFARAEDVLRRILAGEIADEEALMAAIQPFLQGYMGEAYAIGYVMVERMQQVLGDEAVLACLSEPRRTLALYNQAAAGIAGAYRFGAAVVDGLAGSRY